jgi:hypothetical protein
MQSGDTEGAMTVLAPEAVFGDAHAAAPILKEVYVAANGSDEGFQEFLDFSRNHLARPVDDFTLTDYEGREVSFGEIRKDKVTLLAFWFPT